MASQLNASSPLMMDLWADYFSGYDGDPCLGADETSQPLLMFPDLGPLKYGAPPLYSFSDDLSPPLADADMFGVAAAVASPPTPACLDPFACVDPFAWQGGGGGPVPSLWSNGNAAGFDMAPPPPPPPGVGPLHADNPTWQAARRGGGYRAPPRTTPPPRRGLYQHPHHTNHPWPSPPASRPLAAAPAVKRRHSGAAPAARRSSVGQTRRASSSSADRRPRAAVESSDALPGALQGLAAMEQSLRSANHEQQRRLSATYEQWDRRHSSASGGAAGGTNGDLTSPCPRQGFSSG